MRLLLAHFKARKQNTKGGHMLKLAQLMHGRTGIHPQASLTPKCYSYH